MMLTSRALFAPGNMAFYFDRSLVVLPPEVTAPAEAQSGESGQKNRRTAVCRGFLALGPGYRLDTAAAAS
jgi:hypothetical protein